MNGATGLQHAAVAAQEVEAVVPLLDAHGSLRGRASAHATHAAALLAATTADGLRNGEGARCAPFPTL